MDATPGVPGSYDEAVDQAFDAAVAEALNNPALRSQAGYLGLTDDALREYLSGERPKILATATDKTAALSNLYRRRGQPVDHPRMQARHNLLSRFGGESGGRRTQRRIETTAEGGRVTASIRSTIDALKDSLTGAMVPMLRSWLNRQRQQQEERHWNYLRNLDDEVDTSDLHRPVNHRSFVLTDEMASLGRRLARMPGGSVGIAGPRGSGKSTALENVALVLASAERDCRLFQVRVSAPVEYVPREFLVHLHDEICTKLLTPEDRGASPGRSPKGVERLRRWWDAATIVVPALLAVAGVWLMGAHTLDNGLSTVGGALPLVLALATVAASAMLGTWTATQLRAEDQHSYQPAGHPHRHAGAPFLFRPPRTDTPSSTATRKYVAFLGGTVAALSALTLVYAAGLFDWLDAYRASGLALVVISAAVLLARVATSPPVTGSAGVTTGGYMQVLVMTAATAAALGLGVQGLALVSAGQLYEISAGTLIAGGGLAAAAAALAGLRTAPPAAVRDDWEHATDSVTMALRDQRRLRYQRTEESGRTTGAKLGASGASVETGTTASVADVEQPLTVPEITQMTRTLLWQIRQENADENENFKIVICIDELDKLEGGEAARTFLNEIKGVFTTPGVLFLVSVSEEAMANFERRGTGFRDVFNSAFDEMIHVPQLSLSKTADLVGNRSSNIPRPFVALAHCLSAGLARDVIRVLDHMADPDTPQDIQGATRAVVHRELYGMWQVVVSAVRPIPLEPQVTDMLRVLYVIDRCPGAESVEGRCLAREGAFDDLEGLRLDVPESSELEDFRILLRLGGEYLGFAYFCRTLIELFDFERDGALDRFIEAEQAGRLERHSLEYLTRARQHLGVNPRLAWEQISSFRADHEMAPIEFPVALLGVPAGTYDVGAQPEV